MTDDQFKNDYETCAETFSTVRIFSAELSPDYIGLSIGLEPTRLHKRGDEISSSSKKQREKNGWFYSTEGRIQSRDSGRHIDELLALLSPRRSQIQILQQQGCQIDIVTYWVSKGGHGGPTLSPSQMRQLSDLEIPVWWDVYFEQR